MSQVAGDVIDDLTVDTNTPDVAEAAPAVAVGASAAVDDVVVETPEAKHGRKPNGQFASKDGVDDIHVDGVADVEPQTAEQVAAEKARNRRDDPKAAVQAAVAKQREAERKASELEQRLAALEQAQRQPAREEPAKPAAQADWQRYMAMPDAPKEEDFEKFSEFTAAMGVFAADQRFAEREQATRQTAAQRQVEQTRSALNTKFVEQVDAAGGAEFLSAIAPDVLNIPTFDNLQPGQEPTGLHVLGEEIRRSEKVAQWMRHLSEQPDEIQRLATLPPRDLTRSMAITESRWDAAPTGTAPAARASSLAKPPVRPVTGSPSVTVDDGSEEESVDAHIARENARERARRRA